jgi:hypothetical protein
MLAVFGARYEMKKGTETHPVQKLRQHKHLFFFAMRVVHRSEERIIAPLPMLGLFLFSNIYPEGILSAFLTPKIEDLDNLTS